MSEQRFRANFDVSIYDSEKEEYISVSGRGLEEIAKRMNEQQATIQSLKEEIRAYPINEQYAEEIMQQNQKLRIERNNLRRENEQLRQQQRLSTDKRFTSKWLNFEDRVWIDNLTKEQYNEDDVVDLLNNQQDKIQDLEEKINKLPPKIRELWIQE